MAVGRKKGLSEFVPPKKGDELITWATKRLEDAHKIDEFEAKQNLSFTLGNQWAVWDAKRRRMQQDRSRRGDPNAPVRVTANKIGGIVERVIARLTKNAPIPECRPVTDTMADINTARVATRILDHEMNRLKFEQRLTELYFWVLPLGWSFFHVRWDPEAGAVVGQDEEGELRQGDITLDEVPAFELRIDPNARRWRDARWCIRTVAMTREACYDQYGVLPDADGADSMTNEWRMSLDEYTEASAGSEGASDEQFVPVHQFWMRPGGRARPDGLVFTWSGKTILEEPKAFPYAHGQLPFVPLNLLPALGKGPTGRTWVNDLVEQQKDYNDARSREAMVRRTLTPKWLAARGQVDPNRMTSRVEVLEYNPTGPEPKLHMPDGRWMSQYEQAMNRADQEMGDRSGQSDVSSGQAATSAPAASILALQEADETKLAISARELAFFTEQLGFQIIMLVRQFWDEERTIRTWSRDGQLEVSQFSKADIADELDVHVSAESALPRSKSARAQLVTDLWSGGVITDPHVFVRMLDLPGTDMLLETLSLDAKQAEREHAPLLDMEQVTVEPWENHEAHYAKHNEFRKTEEYEALPPDVRAHFDAHCDTHMQIIASLQAAQAGAPAPQGGPAPEDEAPGPHTPGNPTGQNGEYMDPLTGRPRDPLSVAAGMAPSALEGSQVQRRTGAGIGGTGNPGPVPGMTADTQNYRMGN